MWVKATGVGALVVSRVESGVTQVVLREGLLHQVRGCSDKRACIGKGTAFLLYLDQIFRVRSCV